MLLYYLEFLELGTGTCEASASSMLREGDRDHICDMKAWKYGFNKGDKFELH